jgi:hypothetical protein
MLWKFKDACWEQDDDSQSFKIQSIFGKICNVSPVAPHELLVEAKRHPISDLSCSKGLFPSEFKFCPYCQAKLLQNEEISDLWIPPYGSASGLKLYEKKSVSQNDTGVRGSKGKLFPLPYRDGRFAFCSLKLGAKKRLLIAIQRDGGQLWIFRSDNTKKWEVLSGKAGEDSLPAWCWSMAVDSDESGICIPTNNGPVWMTVDWTTSNIQVSRAQGKSVGGPIRIGEYIVAPVMQGDTFAMVFRKDGDKEWSVCSSNYNSADISDHLRKGSNKEACFGIPVLDENKLIAYWTCRGGYVKVTGADSSTGLNWDFRSWETDEHPATALIELGPPYRRIGAGSGFWQLCEDRDNSVRGGIINKIIKIDGDEKIDSEKVECGEFLTTGRVCFSWGDDYWQDIHRRNQRMTEQTELRFPLIQFGEKGLSLIAKVAPWEGRDELGVFTDIFFNRNLKIIASVRFVLEGSGMPEKALYAEEVDSVIDGLNGSLFRISLAQLPEITAFIYNDSLFIYFPETNNCFCWPLELTEG